MTTRVSRIQRQNQRGSAALLVTVAMLVLIAFASLAIDASLGYDERRDAQNAADNAAYAAAYDDCNPKDTAAPNPQAAAREVASRNGFDHTLPDVNVAAVENPPGSGIWTVTIEVIDIDSALGTASPYAPDQLDVTTTATAQCAPDPFLGGYAIFAGSQTCPMNELSINGADIAIQGDVHTNADGSITGSSPSITGDVTYVGSLNDPSGAAPGATPTSAQPYPLDPDLILEYRPGGARTGSDYHAFVGDIDNTDIIAIAPSIATGSNTDINFTSNAIIYATGDIDLKDVTMDATVGVTFVAEGEIGITANGDIRGFDPIDPTVTNSTKMTAFSWNVEPPTCAPGPASAVDINASAITWEGLIFAPNGLVSFSTASATATLDGSIIAYTINLSGDDLTITYDNDANTDPKFILELLR